MRKFELSIRRLLKDSGYVRLLSSLCPPSCDLETSCGPASALSHFTEKMPVGLNAPSVYDHFLHSVLDMEEVSWGSLSKCLLAPPAHSRQSPRSPSQLDSTAQGEPISLPLPLTPSASRLVGASAQVRNGCVNALLSRSPCDLEGPPLHQYWPANH